MGCLRGVGTCGGLGWVGGWVGGRVRGLGGGVVPRGGEVELLGGREKFTTGFPVKGGITLLVALQTAGSSIGDEALLGVPGRVRSFPEGGLLHGPRIVWEGILEGCTPVNMSVSDSA